MVVGRLDGAGLGMRLVDRRRYLAGKNINPCADPEPMRVVARITNPIVDHLVPMQLRIVGMVVLIGPDVEVELVGVEGAHALEVNFPLVAGEGVGGQPRQIPRSQEMVKGPLGKTRSVFAFT